jgi:DNA-binding IscR family transcriptional regulator
MKRDSRLSGILHVVLHMAEHQTPMTSEQLATHMMTNPVVVRRIMAGLRERGIVASAKGHGGGWTIAADLTKITLKDIYEALGSPELFALGNRTESPDCLVEQAVNAALDGAFRDAEAMLIARLGDITMAQLSADFHQRFLARKDKRNWSLRDDA